MIHIDPRQVFQGELLVIAPHMDDEVLACGGTIACLPRKDQIHIVYGTDGSKSPVPMAPWIGQPSPDLVSIRKQEALAAMHTLGVPDGNIHFLEFPDSQLKHHLQKLTQALSVLIRALKPDHLLIPFRYDRHPDHLALHRAAQKALQQEKHNADCVEYFVYHRWQLLPGKDVRKFIRPDQLLEVDIREYSDLKKKSLQCYTSQTTLFYSWQDRPILPPERVGEVSGSPEYFLKYDPALAGATIFSKSGAWIRIAHRVEPFIKQKKEQIASLFRAGVVPRL